MDTTEPTAERQPARKKPNRWLLIGGAILALGLIAQMCGDEESGDGGTSNTSAAECDPVNATILDNIATGLTTDGKGTLSNGVALQTSVDALNGDPMWLVGAELDAPGLEESGDFTLWGTSFDPTGPEHSGLVFAVNATAKEFSDWGDAANPGSPAAEMVDELAASPEVETLESCFGS